MNFVRTPNILRALSRVFATTGLLALAACGADDGSVQLATDGGTSGGGTINCQICETTTTPDGTTAQRCRSVSCEGFTIPDAGIPEPDAETPFDADVVPEDADIIVEDTGIFADADIVIDDADILSDADIVIDDASVDGMDASIDGGSVGPTCRICRTYKYRGMEFQVCEDVECPPWVAADGGEPDCENEAFNGVGYDYYACDETCYGYTVAHGWQTYLCSYLGRDGDAGTIDYDGGCWNNGYICSGSSTCYSVDYVCDDPRFCYGYSPTINQWGNFECSYLPQDAGVDAAADAGVDAAVDAGVDAAADAGVDSAVPDAAVTTCQRIYYPGNTVLYSSTCDESGASCYMTTASYPTGLIPGLDGGTVIGNGYSYQSIPCL